MLGRIHRELQRHRSLALEADLLMQPDQRSDAVEQPAPLVVIGA